MNNFTYYNHTKLVFGKNTENEVGGLTKNIGTRALLHYGGGSIKKTDLYDRVTASLTNAGISYVELGGVVPNPRVELIRDGIALCRREGVDCILAVGGGSVIDSAKCIAVGMDYDGDVWDFFKGTPITHKPLPIGVVLTIPAAGSESSVNMVISNGEEKLGCACTANRPRFAILNPELSCTLPFFQTACGVSDMLAHIMERYFTQTENVDVTDRMCEAVMRSIINHAPTLKNKPDDYAARAEIMWAGTLAHNGLLGLGREEDWASHRIEHQISALYDVTHGAGLSVVFPAWIKYVHKQNLPRFVQWATRVWDVDLAYGDPQTIVDEGIRRLEEFFRRMELPVRLSELGVNDNRLGDMAKKSTPVGNFQRLEYEDVLQILKLAL